VKSDESCALLACAQFRGDALVVESERDAIIPAQVVTNYRDALGGAASLTYRLMSNADHALSSDADQQCYTTLLVHWLSEMIKGARAEVADDRTVIAEGAEGRGHCLYSDAGAP
jgi:hypothetical protein